MDYSSSEDYIDEGTMADLWLMVIESYEERHPNESLVNFLEDSSDKAS